MASSAQQRVLDLLKGMSQRGLDAAKQLLWTELNYDRVAQTLSTRNWSQRAAATLQQDPILLAQAGPSGSTFDVVYTRLSSLHHGRGFPLSIGDERLVVNQLLPHHPYALFLFSDPSEKYWHWVNVRPSKRGAPDAERKVAPPILRRIAVGPHERLRTAAERIQRLDVQAMPPQLFAPSPLSIQSQHDGAFDVEAVTHEFYLAYETTFKELQSYLARQNHDLAWAHDYALQFLNRLMFLYYVQRKGWLGDDPDFLANFWKECRQAKGGANRFVRDWLDVLFFEAFNHGFQAGRSDRQHLPPHLREALAQAPWLNGGLFERNNLDRAFNPTLSDERFAHIFEFFERYNFTISEDTPLDQEVAVDPEMIGRVYESLVNVSDTVDERAEAGIFYTPRVEIDLMCRLSLVDWLTNHLGSEHRNALYETVFAFDAEDKERADEALAKEGSWPALDELLRSVTVLDPACGSGSFLVGMLNVLEDLLARSGARLGKKETSFERKNHIVSNSLYGVDVKEWAIHVAELRLWLQLVIEGDLPPEERQLRPLLPNLTFKLRTGDSLVQEVGGINMAIRHGSSDISPPLKRRIRDLQKDKLAFYGGAQKDKPKHEREVRASELALFRDVLRDRVLRLENRAIELDQALRPQTNLFGEEQTTQIGLERVEMEAEHDSLRTQAQQARQARSALVGLKDVPFVWDIAFVEVMEGERRGFDIVIGNPPYVRQERIRDPHSGEAEPTVEDKRAYKAKLMRSVYAAWPKSMGYNPARDQTEHKLDAKSDLYIYFYFHGLSLLADKGSFCFITSNSWLDVGYGRDLQEFLLTRGQVRLVIDNKARRSFANADVNTVIVLLGAPVDAVRPRREGLEHTARFVMLNVPFEEVLSPVVWEEVVECAERCTRPEHRTFPLPQGQLLANGMDPEKGQYAGDKWGGKYLRAPDIYWTILRKGQPLVRCLGDYFDGERYLNTGGADGFFILTKVDPLGDGLCDVCNDRVLKPGGRPFEGRIEEGFLVPLIKDFPKLDRRIVIRGHDAYCLVVRARPTQRVAKYIAWGESQGYDQRSVTRNQRPWYKPTRQMLRAAKILVPRSFSDRFVIHHNPKGYLSLRYYRLHPKAGEEAQLVAFLNSTLIALILETLGNKSLGQGVLDFFMADFLTLRVPVVERRELASALVQMSVRAVQDVWSEYGASAAGSARTFAPPSDRRALDDIVFDALALTQGERDAVYEGVISLVEARLKKAESLQRRVSEEAEEYEA